MALIALLLGGLALTVLRTTLHRQEALVDQYLGELVRTEALVSASNEAARKARDYLLTGDAAHLEGLATARARFLQLYDALSTGPAASEERALLLQVRATWGTAGVAANRAMEARQRTGRVLGETERIVRDEALPERARLDAALAALTQQVRARYETAQREADAAARRAWRMLALGFAFAVVASLALGALVRRALKQRQRAEEELLRAAEFRERLIGIVSHDLRTPLTAITASAGLLLRNTDVPEHARRSVRRIASSAERMATMIEELLDFTRVRLGGGIPIHRTPADLVRAVRNVVEEAELAFPGRRVALEAPAELEGTWDVARLSQAVGNLLRNALTYSPEGSPVTVALREEPTSVRVEVHNLNRHGPIPAALLPALFDPFRRGELPDTGSGREGLGLGLYISREIAGAHRGRIDVRSTQEGTVFTLELPRD